MSMRRVLITVVITICCAAMGRYVAALTQWWYQLGPTQTSLVQWAYPLILGFAGAYYAWQIAGEKD